MERPESDPGTERSGQRGDIGLEGESADPAFQFQPMRHLGMGAGGGGAADADGGESPYPERLGEPDCIYYVRTGLCRYGARCRFNHPHDRGAQAYGGARAGGGDYPARPGQHVCQYYMRTGSCKFGSSCKYHHPRHGAGSTTALTFNFHGYPMRPGEKECSYYMRTGLCKFAMTCKFHHPQPDNVQVPEVIPPSAVYPTIPHAPPQQFMVPGSYVQGPYAPMLFSPGVVPYSGWTPYMASYSAVPAPSTQSTAGAAQIYGVPPVSPVGSVYAGPYPPMTSFAGPSSSIQKEITHPERPSQPECQHYLRTGECKYGSSCRYHHPAERSSKKASYAVTPVVLPLRPGAPTCTHFIQHGVCKFGPTCKFNHPTDSPSYSPSTSSLSDTPVAPYPTGHSVVTVAPSSSFSDPRIEAISGSNDPPTNSSSAPSNSTAPLSPNQEPSQSSATGK